MNVEDRLFAALSGHAGLTAIVGARIYPDALPERTVYPAVVYSRTETQPIRSISGHYFGADVSLQVSCWSTTRTEADAVAVQAEQALQMAELMPTNRVSGYDEDTDLCASVIDVEVFEEP